jgi:hypothetical protein
MLLPLLLILAQVRVGGPTQVQDAEHPLRIRILERNVTRGAFGMRMWGRANLFTGQQEEGFDYEADCDEVFMVSHGEELYSARWKKQDKELEMLISKFGSGKSEKCTVKTDLKPYVYVFEAGRIVTKPAAKLATE